MPTYAEAMRTSKESLVFLRAKASKRPFPVVGVDRLAAAAKLTLIFEFSWGNQNFGRVVVPVLCARPILARGWVTPGLFLSHCYGFPRSCWAACGGLFASGEGWLLLGYS